MNRRAAGMPRRLTSSGPRRGASRPHPFRRLQLAGVAAIVSLASVAGMPLRAADASEAAGIEFFERKVRPLLADNCFSCHGEEKQKSHLRLDSPAAIRAGGDGGAVLVPGQPDKSRLVVAITYQDENLQMPPKRKLAGEQVKILTEWVKLGAPMPAGEPVANAGTARKEFRITDRDRSHWAFQPVRRPRVPAAQPARGLMANPIDAFIHERLKAKGLAPNPPAGQRELIRRAYYDLLGLPPSPKEVEAFLADASPRAWENLIDRLLESPHYGEQWGRHWLDLVRYAESNSYERDGPKPNAWRYRDYVIAAFNRDKPYDRFVREQLAGDELPAPDPEAIVATGFYRLGIWDDEPADRLQSRYDGLDDIVTTTGQVFLGLTVDCARCHNHKLDPIPQADYYRLLSFFHNVNHYANGGPTDELPLFDTPQARQDFQERVRARERQRGEIQAALTEMEARFRELHAKNQQGGTPEAKPDFNKLMADQGARLLGQEQFERYQKQKKELEALKANLEPPAKALGVTESGTNAPETFILVRGNPHVPGDKVEPGFLEVLGAPKPETVVPRPTAASTGRRSLLADWIVSPANQLTARVMVNRLWQYHFGRGLVRSPNNFGLQGDKPTHPELLDWLASEFVASGWRLKAMHRLIMNSQAYRMSSHGRPEALAADPVNDLFWRFDLRRLNAEEIRDSILAVNGSLNLKMFGPSIYVDIPKEVLAGQSRPGNGWGNSPAAEQARRSVYIHVKRSLLTPILESFDIAETDRSTPTRFATTQPTQALSMLNSAFLNRQAEVFAQRLQREAGNDLNAQVRLGLYLATSRLPSGAEIGRGADLIQSLVSKEKLPSGTALKYFCLMALNLNEALYLD